MGDTEKKQNSINEIVSCNKCGKTLQLQGGMDLEDSFLGEKVWGYFSAKDLERHTFRLCERCYDEMVGSFVIPVSRERNNEPLS